MLANNTAFYSAPTVWETGVVIASASNHDVTLAYRSPLRPESWNVPRIRYEFSALAFLRSVNIRFQLGWLGFESSLCFGPKVANLIAARQEHHVFAWLLSTSEER